MHAESAVNFKLTYSLIAHLFIKKIRKSTDKLEWFKYMINYHVFCNICHKQKEDRKSISTI